MKKRILAVAAAMAVAAVMMFGGTVSAFADEARTADIDVSLQTGDTFLVQHKTIKVSSTLSEKYEYDNRSYYIPGCSEKRRFGGLLLV